ncbi:PREDICTED: rho GTPase-activating protein 12-like, partial [Tinamus guttatus]|uniref:rho GTPase-activating protein 12-like n=1 Tax=Tinamus guttatus TaxID=94827 RepID=UPI00052F0E73
AAFISAHYVSIREGNPYSKPPALAALPQCSGREVTFPGTEAARGPAWPAPRASRRRLIHKHIAAISWAPPAPPPSRPLSPPAEAPAGAGPSQELSFPLGFPLELERFVGASLWRVAPRGPGRAARPESARLSRALGELNLLNKSPSSEAVSPGKCRSGSVVVREVARRRLCLEDADLRQQKRSDETFTARLCGVTELTGANETSSKISGNALSRALYSPVLPHALPQITTRSGNEFLLQSDIDFLILDWFHAIKNAIDRLSKEQSCTSRNLELKLKRSSSIELLNNLDAESKEPKPEHRKSLIFRLNYSASDTNDRNRVKSRLKKFISRRPSLKTLQEKGLIKDQIFGSHLHLVCEHENSTVPKFVRLCIEAVERRGLDVDGIYRVSGNLATIQKLRFVVNQGK